ncbi:MAG TPA: hypothetical protein VG426_11085 [Candidatus Dormibacteraeota bacterium]|nr:hypothetical protein [Candidatus Dormibacteraeota bacterium]
MSSSRRASGKPRTAGRTSKARPAQAATKRASAKPARLSIKPALPQGVRVQLLPSTKRRPSGPRRLSDVELDEDEVLIDAFIATLDGVNVRITAVLERTCVYVGRDGDRRLASKKDLWVEADKLPIRRRGIG